jgi:hypothetical protein
VRTDGHWQEAEGRSLRLLDLAREGQASRDLLEPSPGSSSDAVPNRRPHVSKRLRYKEGRRSLPAAARHGRPRIIFHGRKQTVLGPGQNVRGLRVLSRNTKGLSGRHRRRSESPTDHPSFLRPPPTVQGAVSPPGCRPPWPAPAPSERGTYGVSALSVIVLEPKRESAFDRIEGSLRVKPHHVNGNCP